MAEKPIPEPPARTVKAPEPGPSTAAPVAKPEIITPKPKEPVIAVEKPKPEPVAKKIVVTTPVPEKPVVETKTPASPVMPITEAEKPRKKEPAVVTAAREPAREPSTLPKPEPFTDETKAAAEETFLKPAPVETAHLVPDTTPEAPDADIVILMEKRKSLLDQKAALDKTFHLLLAEKKALEAERTRVRDKTSIQKYNENVIRLNERIKGFKEEDTALRDEIEYYNKLISQAQ
ncbi:MAG: hypothetical protein C4548_17035 [Desulfobacteraceae bacterium]|nr:MAG: hypothetical protein C4548_17035 [Desulfobacteraceae bacterium]